MQRLEVSGAVRPLYGSLGFKGLMMDSGSYLAYSCMGNVRVFVDIPKGVQ